MKKTRYKLSLLCVLSSMSWTTFAQNQVDVTVPKDRGGPRLVSSQNDYAFLKDESHRNDRALEQLKYINLDDNPDSYLTIGGEVRYYYQHWDHFTNGIQENDKNSSLQQRLKVYADYHFDEQKRVFVEIGDNWEFDAEIEAKINYSPFDIQQVFFDYGHQINSNNDVNVRLGRFYMPMSSGVLLATRDGASVWYAYDGAKIDLTLNQDIKVETFYTHPVEFKNGSFNNKTNQDIDVYGVSINKKLSHNHAEVYYFSKDNHDTSHDRASIGLRYYGKSGKLNYDLEGIYQTGTVKQADIKAYGLFSRINYQLDPQKRLGLRFNYFSGDQKLKDNDVKTFESISPGAAYISTTGLFALKNLFQTEASFLYSFNEQANLKVAGSLLNKANKNDHIYYGGAGIPLGKAATSSTEIAQLYDVLFNYKFNSNFNAMLNYAYIDAGKALKETNGDSSNYFGVIGQFRF